MEIKKLKMRYLYWVTLVLFMFVIVINDLSSQKKITIKSEEDVIKYASEALDNSVKTGDLFLLGKKYNIKGNYIYDLTLGKRGKVITVFAVSRDGSLDGQNLLKDQLKEMQFNFKIPKGRTYKFQYTVSLK